MSVDKLGARIRRFREFREMSREELAETAGLPLATVVALEEENLYASIGPLQKVARALKARLGTFMDDVQCTDPIIARGERREADLTMQRTRNKSESYRYHALGKGKADRNMEPFYIDILPDNGDVALSSHQGEEFIIVVSGRLKVIYGKEEHLLDVGDTIYYNSIVPHYVGAAGGESCSIYAVMYYP